MKERRPWFVWVLVPFFGIFILLSFFAVGAVSLEAGYIKWEALCIVAVFNLFIVAAIVCCLGWHIIILTRVTRFMDGKKALKPIVDLCRKIKYFTEKMDKFEYFIEWDDDCFYTKEKFGFAAAKIKHSQKWSEVKQIHTCMLDCYSHHTVGLCLTSDEHNDGPIVTEDHEGYKDFVEYLRQRFPEFNETNFRNIERCFPMEGSLPCWDANQEIADLLITETTDEIKMIWADSNELYMQINLKEALGSFGKPKNFRQKIRDFFGF